jgi:hypothetical protein
MSELSDLFATKLSALTTIKDGLMLSHISGHNIYRVREDDIKEATH